MPYGSRATNIRRARVSQIASAYMPRSSPSMFAPSRRYSRSSTSVSVFE
jgi:hypothetical protein